MDRPWYWYIFHHFYYNFSEYSYTSIFNLGVMVTWCVHRKGVGYTETLNNEQHRLASPIYVNVHYQNSI